MENCTYTTIFQLATSREGRLLGAEQQIAETTETLVRKTLRSPEKGKKELGFTGSLMWAIQFTHNRSHLMQRDKDYCPHFTDKETKAESHIGWDPSLFVIKVHALSHQTKCKDIFTIILPI